MINKINSRLWDKLLWNKVLIMCVLLCTYVCRMYAVIGIDALEPGNSSQEEVLDGVYVYFDTDIELTGNGGISMTLISSDGTEILNLIPQAYSRGLLAGEYIIDSKYQLILIPPATTVTYRVEAGTVRSVSNPDQVNEEIVWQSYLPKYLTLYWTVSGISDEYDTFIGPVKIPRIWRNVGLWSDKALKCTTTDIRATLFKEGEKVCEMPVTAQWEDWNLFMGQVQPATAIDLEKGIHYTLVLPEGVICGFQESFCNREITLDIIGDGPEPSTVDDIRNNGSSEVKWRDMQGRTIQTPTDKGLYIRISEGKSEKIIIK